MLRAPAQGLRGQAQKVNVALDLRIAMDWVQPLSSENFLFLATLTDMLAFDPLLPLGLALFYAEICRSRKRTGLWPWYFTGHLTNHSMFMAIRLGEKTLGEVASEVDVSPLKWSFLQFPGFRAPKQTHNFLPPSHELSALLATLS